MSVPGVPGADLVVVESDFVLAGSEAFFDGPARSGDVDEFCESGVVRVVAMVEREFTIVDSAADQVLVVGVG
jgi:exo-beta-1,3-glucanase (GH17 family)